MDSTLSEARSVLAKAKEDMARYYNQCQVPAPEYHIGDRVYLDARSYILLLVDIYAVHIYAVHIYAVHIYLCCI